MRVKRITTKIHKVMNPDPRRAGMSAIVLKISLTALSG